MPIQLPPLPSAIDGDNRMHKLGLLGMRTVAARRFQLVEPFFEGRHPFGQGYNVLDGMTDRLFGGQVVLLPEV